MIFAVLPSLFVNRSHLSDESFGTSANGNVNTDDFKFLAITDLDSGSKVGADGKKYHSLLLEGRLKRDSSTGKFEVLWGESFDLFSGHNEAGRGMELSELVEFNGHLYTMDDRSGIIFEVFEADGGQYRVSPKMVLSEGDGSFDKGMKIEWATVKGENLFVGSFGKEYTDKTGAIVSTSNNWIAVLDSDLNPVRYDWSQYYQNMREATGTTFPGYMIHEAANWSEHLRKWVFLPRRVSAEPYDDLEDESRGSNKLLLVSEDLKNVEVREAGEVVPARGFSSFKFLPGSRDSIIVALKSEENSENDTQSTFITVFDLEGVVLMSEVEFPVAFKFEGIEVWPV